MYDISQYKVADILPQKSTAIYIDKMISFDDKSQQLVAEKRITEDEYLLNGHFPDNPVVPGILTIEALSQACTLCGWAVVNNEKIGQTREGIFEHLTMKISIKFKNKILHKDTILLYARLKEVVNNVSIFKVKAINKLDCKVIAIGEIMGIANKINGEAENQKE